MYKVCVEQQECGWHEHSSLASDADPEWFCPVCNSATIRYTDNYWLDLNAVVLAPDGAGGEIWEPHDNPGDPQTSST